VLLFSFLIGTSSITITIVIVKPHNRGFFYLCKNSSTVKSNASQTFINVSSLQFFLLRHIFTCCRCTPSIFASCVQFTLFCSCAVFKHLPKSTIFHSCVIFCLRWFPHHRNSYGLPALSGAGFFLKWYIIFQ